MKGILHIHDYSELKRSVSARNIQLPKDKGVCDLNVKNVLKLIERSSNRCALTGQKLTPKTAALDHRIPVSRGGMHLISNAQLLHRDVNRAKGTLTNEEFIALCRLVVAHVDQSNVA